MCIAIKLPLDMLDISYERSLLISEFDCAEFNDLLGQAQPNAGATWAGGEKRDEDAIQ